jgi:hypothetical protein
MFFKQLLHSSTARLLLIALVLCGIALTGSRSTGRAEAAPHNSIEHQQVAQAQVLQVEPSETQAVVVTCTSVEVATYDNRIHVRCAEVFNGINFFAASTADIRHSNRLLSVLLTAHATSKPVNIWYEPSDTSGTSFGCRAEDCRVLLGAAVRP